MANEIVNAMVGGVTQELAIVIAKEGKYLLGVDKQVIDSLSNHLKHMNSFLKDFDWVHQEHKSAKAFINKMRDLAYDIEDVVDRYALCTSETSSYSRSSILITKRNLAKRIITEINERIKDIYDDKIHFQIGLLDRIVFSAAPTSSGTDTRQSHIADVMVGFTDVAERLKERLNHVDPKRAAVSIVGMGGLGKTLLAKKIYNDISIAHSFNHRAWVYVSQQNTPEGIVLGILKHFTKVTAQIKEMHEEALGKLLHHHLKGSKYLIVLDGVWKPRIWHDLKRFLPDDGNGSRILLTTRINKVALQSSDPAPHYLRLLNQEESWELFCRKAFRGESFSQQWEQVGREIAKKCDGLPLAIRVLGILLSEKWRTFDEWSRAANSVSSFLSKRPAECQQVLALSYNELPYYLKPCFLCFSTFPINEPVPTKTLIQFWVSEGLIKGNHGETKEETAERYLDMLVDQSLINLQNRSDPEKKTCSLHFLFHEFCISEARRQRFVQDDGKWLGIENNHRNAVETSSRRRAPIAEDADVVGFTDEVETLVERLTTEDLKLTAISIVGMGGLGKTVLAKKLYNNCSVRDKFTHCAWVYVGQENTLNQLILSILKWWMKVTEEMVCMNREELGKVLYDQLKGKKYLIVMDNVWKPEDWKELSNFFPDDSCGSRILLTTRSTEVAICADSDPMNPPHYLHFLDRGESWKLFCRMAFPGEDVSQKWEKLGRQIAHKCGGLPLAIADIGNLLSEKRRGYNEWSRVAQEREIYDEWLKIASHVSTFLYSHSPECKENLALSYNDLTSHLKPCFLYLSVFPEDYQIPARQLIQLWVSEGFIQENGNETMEDTAGAYLETLANRGLIQVVQRRSDGGVKTCGIHCLFRDICLSEARRKKFLQIHGSVNSTLLDQPRRVVGNANTITDILKEGKQFSKLRSLLCFTHMSGEYEEWSRLFKTVNLLRVFKVFSVSILPDEVEKLIHLRYLGLDKNSMQHIPASICNLPNLQVLDVRSKFIRSAPPGIWKLKKLRHAYFIGPTFLPPPPPPSSSSSRNGGHDDHNKDSSLMDLQTLSTISANSCTPQVFLNMPNLRNLGIKVKGFSNDLSENLAMLNKLHTLKLAGAPDFPPLISLPYKFPPNLTKLTLCETQLEEDPMPLLGELKKLEILKLSNNAYTGSEMVCYAHGFPVLQRLKLVNIHYTTKVICEEGALLKLHHLYIDGCRDLQMLTGMEHLTTLQVVDLQNSTIELRQYMQGFKKGTLPAAHLSQEDKYGNGSTLGITTSSDQSTEALVKCLTRGKWTEVGESSKGTT